MSAEIELFKTICEAADMGRDSLNQVIGRTKSQQLNRALESQCREYDVIYMEAEKQLKHYGHSPKNISPIAKVNSRIGVNLQTKMANNEVSKIADMVIKGSTMGVTKITKKLHAYHGNDQTVKQIAQQMVQTEESNIQGMKPFL